MKKIFYLASIAALAFSSCAKDETTEANLGTIDTGSKIVASMEADATRTELVKNGNAYDIVWKSSDALSVYERDEDTYETTAFHNRMFQMDNASDGLATGAFKGSALKANGTYVAVYPYNKTVGDKMNPNWLAPYYTVSGVGEVYMLDPEAINVVIPAEQEYVGSGTFNTNTIPAVSTEFVVGTDGNATVKMQPVVDYVMVDIAATEAIESISLQFYADNQFSTPVNIAGETNLKAYYANGAIRYVTDNNNLDSNIITLKTKDLADNVSLSKPNTYVFAVPGDLLGKGNDKGLNWVLYINDTHFMTSSATQNESAPSYYTSVNNDKINTYLNAYNSKGHNRTTGVKDHKVGTVTSEIDEYAMNLENTVFYLNKSKDGQVLPFVYNPDKEYLINNELDLFYYFANYEEKDLGNAYVAEGATFDLSIKHMSELVEEINTTTYPGLNSVINAYIMSGKASFPTIETYKHEFKGNGAALTNIERPLAGENGLFGTLSNGSKVQNLELANVEAKSSEATVDGKKVILKGNVLATAGAGSITNITVSNLDADAVIGSGNLSDYKQIKIGEAGLDKDLNHVVGELTMTGNYTYSAEAWAAVSTVGESVFHTIVPGSYTNSYGNTVLHTVASLPEGAAYNKFVCEVSYPDNYTNVLSVLIGDVSYWTGGVIDNAAPAWNTSKPILIQYAEQFANGEKNGDIAYKLTRSMNLNYTNTEVSWTAPEYTTLVGGENIVVSDLVYVAAAPEQNVSDAADVAPFKKLNNVSGITFDGISIDIETPSGKVVPRKISGLANKIQKIEDVTINNLVIDAYSLANNNDVINDPHYYDGSTKQRYVGYLSAVAEDISAKNVTINGVKSNVQALTAAVACLDLTSMNAYFNNVDLTGTIVKAKGQEDIKEFAMFSGYKYNLAGTLVGLAANKSASQAPYEVGVKFNGCTPAQPVFLFSTVKNEKAIINVLYNDTVAETLSHPGLED